MGDAFGGIDNCIGAKPVMPIQIINRAGLAEMRDVERLRSIHFKIWKRPRRGVSALSGRHQEVPVRSLLQMARHSE